MRNLRQANGCATAADAARAHEQVCYLGHENDVLRAGASCAQGGFQPMLEIVALEVHSRLNSLLSCPSARGMWAMDDKLLFPLHALVMQQLSLIAIKFMVISVNQTSR